MNSIHNNELRVALLVNIPAPYRTPIYDRLAERLGNNFHVIYMARSEKNRNWGKQTLRHEHVYLNGFTLFAGRRNVHIRFGVLWRLVRFRPDVVLTVGFNPPMLMGWLYARLFHKSHIVMADGWISSDSHLSSIHRFVRRWVFSSSRAFVGASEKTFELFKSYGIAHNIFKSCLCIDNSRFASLAGPISLRPFDLVFAGQLIDRKMPMFFADVVKKLSKRLPKLSVLVIGDGPLRQSLKDALSLLPNTRATFTGHLQQDELPNHFVQGKIFCFPTKRDAWGVVANEACASGMPVITCTNAGCAGELIVNNSNGYVLPLDATQWADHAEKLLKNPALLENLSFSAQEKVREFTYDYAAQGIWQACQSTRTR